MYKAQIVCIIIILFIMVFYFYSERRTASTKWFSLLLITAVVQLLFDICSVYTVNRVETISPILNKMVHFFFMTLMLMLFFIAYKYLEALIEEEKGGCIYRIKYAIVPVVLAGFSLCFLPIKYIETPNGNYSHGPAVFGVYVCVAWSIALIVRLLIKHGKDIPKKKRRAVVIAMLSEAPVAVYQIFVPTSLISCLGIVLLIIGLYMTVENQDARLVKLLEKETKRADVANQAKTNFLANMSHEIRTPINAVLGMNEMILRESREPDVREYAKDVSGAAKSLLSIINDILDITKIEAGKLQIFPTEYVFFRMIHDVTNMISFKAKAKELEFIVNIDETIPGRMIGDDVRIRQILVNILNNAVKYTHKGSVTLEVHQMPSEKENFASILFSVKDTGIGIKEEDIQKLFIPFERIEEKRNRNIEGTGLGMNISMQLLDLLNSKLEVESVYGKGSVFSFVLQQEIIDKTPVGDFHKQIQSEEEEFTEEYQTFEAPDAKILVVDDNEMNRRVFCSLLKHTKIQIDQASSGKESIEKAKKYSYDIIFMDHMMPEMDGIEAFQVIKSSEACLNTNTPVIILTANAILGAKERYLNEGFKDYLSKPIDAQQLENMIENLLDKKMLHYVTRTIYPQEESKRYDLSDLPVVDGLDWTYASAHFNDKEALIENVRFFVSAMAYEAKELENLFEKIHLAEGMKNYSIKVHSMKSSAGNIGIVPLSGMAKVLEDAAKNGDETVVNQLTPIFLKYWYECQEQLRVFSDTKKERKNAKEYKEEIQKIFIEIKSAAEEFDIDALDGCKEQLEQYYFDGEQETFIEQIKGAIVNLDTGYLSNIEVL